MHDSASFLKATEVTRYLELKQINILKWPGNNSPNSTSIENSWYMIKKTIFKKKTPSLEILQKELKKVWCQG